MKHILVASLLVLLHSPWVLAQSATPAGEISQCARMPSPQDRLCFESVERDVAAGKIPRKAVYASLSIDVPCADPTRAAILGWFYGPDLGKDWEPEARRYLLKCLKAEPSAEVVGYVATLFGRSGDPGRLKASEWASVKDACTSTPGSGPGAQGACLRLVGVAPFDRAFGSVTAELAFVSRAAGGTDAPADTQIAAGAAVCRLKPTADPAAELRDRPRAWTTGFEAQCAERLLAGAGAGALRAHFAAVIADEGAPAYELLTVTDAVRTHAPLARAPEIRSALTACRDGAPGRTVRHQACDRGLTH